MLNLRSPVLHRAVALASCVIVTLEGFFFFSKNFLCKNVLPWETQRVFSFLFHAFTVSGPTPECSWLSFWRAAKRFVFKEPEWYDITLHLNGHKEEHDVKERSYLSLYEGEFLVTLPSHTLTSHTHCSETCLPPVSSNYICLLTWPVPWSENFMCQIMICYRRRATSLGFLGKYLA